MKIPKANGKTSRSDLYIMFWKNDNGDEMSKIDTSKKLWNLMLEKQKTTGFHYIGKMIYQKA